MTFRSSFPTLLLVASICALTGCPKSAEVENSAAKSAGPEKKLIIAVAYPLEYLTQRIAGPEFDVRCPVPTGELASKWKPNRDEIQLMQSAEMIIANGVGARFAKWLEMASIPANKVCNSATRGLSLKDFIEIEDVRFTHSHGNLGEHSHPTNCAYTWLHPELALKQAKYIQSELARKYPDQTSGFAQRFAELSEDLKEVQAAFEALPKSAETEFAAVFTANPDLKFFSRACNWNDLHLKWFETPEPEVAVAELEKYILGASDRPTVKHQGKTLLLSTYPFPEALLKALEPQNVTVVVIDKLDQRPATGDYLSVMRENIARLTK